MDLQNINIMFTSSGQILINICCEAVLLHYIVNVYFLGDRCLQCYALPVITFCLSLLNAIAGYFVFR